MFVPHANEIWTKSYGPNYTKFWAFWQKKQKTKTKTNKQTKKKVIYNHFWQRVDAILEDFSVAEIIVWC